MTRPAAGTQIPVPVTQDHIDRGLPEEACGCAVALAVLDAARSLALLPAADSVSVVYGDDGEYVSARAWITPGAWFRLVLGLDAWKFMRAVDAYQPVEPCTLTGVVA